jgi:predicted RNA-binding Zn-ribbon protein involved in translation (DUF1610 family)
MANGDVSHRGAPFLVEKIVVLGMTSGGLGALFGVLAGGAMGLGFMAAVCAALGAGLGLLMSPLFIWGMWAQRGCMCVLLVALVTGLAAILAGLAMRPNDGPLVPILVSTVVYGGISSFIGIRSRAARKFDPARCATCGYLLEGLDAAMCPECGHVVERTAAPRDHRR